MIKDRTKLVTTLALGAALGLGACDAPSDLESGDGSEGGGTTTTPATAAGESAQAAAQDDVELQTAALNLEGFCLNPFLDGVSCPAGFNGSPSSGVVPGNGPFTCSKKVYHSPHCNLFRTLKVKSGWDKCESWFGDADQTPHCDSGYTLIKNGGTGDKDICRKTEYAYPQGCFGEWGQEKNGVGCPDSILSANPALPPTVVIRAEVASAKFRCVEAKFPKCPPFTVLQARPLSVGPDRCVTAGGNPVSAPSCLDTDAIDHTLEQDFDGINDRCAAHGWPVPSPVAD